MNGDEADPGVRIDLRGAQGVQIGHSNFQANVTVVAGPAVRSAYLHQVRLIAPKALYDRESELAELAQFCSGPGAGAYAWWRAGAWAGKSALMAWFVLHPPPGVRVVSFFVTARYAGQSDRVAFTDVVLEQLAELLEQPMPAYLTEATRDAHFRAMLQDAAMLCQDRGERLVLIVDGLDEDRGVVAGPDAHSIAALLPAPPVFGMRIVVAGRADPPLPADVPDDHPLRDDSIVRKLGTAAPAQAVKRDAERELKRLLYGTTVEQDLLGLVTASGGGLSSADLSTLTDVPVWQVEDHLHAVSGRTFTRRGGPRAGHSVPEVYLLGHEELQRRATAYLEGARLDAYRQRLRAWADQYRQQNWPADTPEYLFRGYFRMVRALHDVSEVVACALDRARRDRMLDYTGGDAAALEELAAAQDALLEADQPDLRTMALLAAHRDHIVERNTDIPSGLPAVWATLGHMTRAEELAYGMSHDWQRDQALISLVKLTAKRGDLTHAERLARSVNTRGPASPTADNQQRITALALVAEAAAQHGDSTMATTLLTEIEALTNAITEPSRRIAALITLMDTATACGDHSRAAASAAHIEPCIDAIADPHEQVRELTTASRAMASQGDRNKADALVTRAEGLARTIPDAEARDRATGWVANCVASSGDYTRAETLLRKITDADTLGWIQRDLVGTIARRGDVDHAEALARSIGDPYWHRSGALAEVGEALAERGELDRAEALARSSRDISVQSPVLASLVKAMAEADDLDRASALISDIHSGYWQTRALAALAGQAAGRGDHVWAAMLARQAARAATDIEESTVSEQLDALTAVAAAVADSGDQALGTSLANDIEQTARAHVGRYQQKEPVQALAQALAHCSDPTVARALTKRIERLTQRLQHPDDRNQVLISLVRSVAVTQGHKRAKALISAISTPYQRTDAKASLVDGLSERGDYKRAEAVARNMTPSYRKEMALAGVAQAASADGDSSRAESLLDDTSDPYRRVIILSGLLKATYRRGEQARAIEIADRMDTITAAITEPLQQAWALTVMAKTLAHHGQYSRAETLARSITAPWLKVRALGSVLQASAALGNRSRAAELADLAEAAIQTIEHNTLNQEEAIADLTRAVASTGDYRRAEALVRLTEDLPNGQRWALPALVSTMARNGQPTRAETLARSVSDLDHQGRALAALVAHVGPPQERQLLALALRITKWTTSVNALAACQPDAVTTIADFLIELPVQPLRYL